MSVQKAVIQDLIDETETLKEKLYEVLNDDSLDKILIDDRDPRTAVLVDYPDRLVKLPDSVFEGKKQVFFRDPVKFKFLWDLKQHIKNGTITNLDIITVLSELKKENETRT